MAGKFHDEELTNCRMTCQAYNQNRLIPRFCFVRLGITQFNRLTVV